MTHLIIGLGNPDKKYNLNRHNVGWLAIDFLCNELGKPSTFKSEHNALVFKSEFTDEKIVLAKPTTYMNLSGNAVGALATFYKITPENIIILHDDVDLPFGQIKIKIGGGNAGHNGLRDIDAKIGKNYHRVRIGVDHPKNISGMENITVADYVLSNFSKPEQEILQKEVLSSVSESVKEIIQSDKK